jgi:hypothetical protein
LAYLVRGAESFRALFLLVRALQAAGLESNRSTATAAAVEDYEGASHGQYHDCEYQDASLIIAAVTSGSEGFVVPDDNPAAVFDSDSSHKFLAVSSRQWEN